MHKSSPTAASNHNNQKKINKLLTIKKTKNYRILLLYNIHNVQYEKCKFVVHFTIYEFRSSNKQNKQNFHLILYLYSSIRKYSLGGTQDYTRSPEKKIRNQSLFNRNTRYIVTIKLKTKNRQIKQNTVVEIVSIESN